MRMLWGKRTIVVQGLNSSYLVRLWSSTCDFYGHYGKGRENTGLEVAFVTFQPHFIGWISVSWPQGSCRVAWRCRENVCSRGALDGFGERGFTPCFGDHKIIVKSEYHQAADQFFNPVWFTVVGFPYWTGFCHHSFLWQNKMTHLVLLQKLSIGVLERILRDLLT